MILHFTNQEEFSAHDIARYLTWDEWITLCGGKLDSSQPNIALPYMLIMNKNLPALRFIQSFLDEDQPSPLLFSAAIEVKDLTILDYLINKYSVETIYNLFKTNDNFSVMLSMMSAPCADVLAWLIEQLPSQLCFETNGYYIEEILRLAINENRLDIVKRMSELTQTSAFTKSVQTVVYPIFARCQSVKDVKRYFQCIPAMLHQEMVAYQDFLILKTAISDKNTTLFFYVIEHAPDMGVLHLLDSNHDYRNALIMAAEAGNLPMMKAIKAIAPSILDNPSITFIQDNGPVTITLTLRNVPPHMPPVRLNLYDVLLAALRREELDIVYWLLAESGRIVIEDMFSHAQCAPFVYAWEQGYTELTRLFLEKSDNALAFALQNPLYSAMAKSQVRTYCDEFETNPSALGISTVTTILKYCCDFEVIRALLNTRGIQSMLSNHERFVHDLLRTLVERGERNKLICLLDYPPIRERVPAVLQSLDPHSVSQTSRSCVGLLYTRTLARAIVNAEPYDYLLPAFYEQAFLTWRKSRENSKEIKLNINVNDRENSMHTSGSLKRIVEGARKDFPDVNFDSEFNKLVEYVTNRLEGLEGHRQASTNMQARLTFIPEDQQERKAADGYTRDADGKIMSSREQEIATLHTVMRLLKLDPSQGGYCYRGFNWQYRFEYMMGILYTYACAVDHQDALMGSLVTIRRGHNSDKDPNTGQYYPRARSGDDWMTCSSGYEGRCYQDYVLFSNILHHTASNVLHPFDAAELNVDMHSQVRDLLTQSLTQLPAADAKTHLANLVHFTLFAPTNALFADDDFRAAQEEARAACAWVCEQINSARVNRALQQTVAPSVTMVVDRNIQDLARHTMIEALGFLDGAQPAKPFQYQRMHEVLVERILPALLSPRLAERDQGLTADEQTRIGDAFEGGTSMEKRQEIQQILADNISLYVVMNIGTMGVSTRQKEHITQLVNHGFTTRQHLSTGFIKASAPIRHPLQINAWLELRHLAKEIGLDLSDNHLFDQASSTVDRLAQEAMTRRRSPIQRFQTRLWQRLSPVKQMETMAQQGLAPASLKLAELYLAGQLPTLTTPDRSKAREMADWYSLIAARQASEAGVDALVEHINAWRRNQGFVWSSLEEAQTEAGPELNSLVQKHLRYAAPRPVALPIDSDDSDDEAVVQGIAPKADLLKAAVEKATYNYSNWHRTTRVDEVNRGKGRGYFSWFRHGALGLENAARFNQSVQDIAESAHTNEQVLDLVIALLGDKGVRLHRHSFATYVLDSVQETTSIIIPKNERNNSYSRQAALSALMTLRMPERAEASTSYSC